MADSRPLMTGYQFDPSLTKEQQTAIAMPPGHDYCVMRPMVANCPDGDPGWEEVACQRCGKPCWKRPDLEPAEYPPNVHPVCTDCALRVAAGQPLRLAK